jgi:hypothetical protein
MPLVDSNESRVEVELQCQFKRQLPLFDVLVVFIGIETDTRCLLSAQFEFPGTDSESAERKIKSRIARLFRFKVQTAFRSRTKSANSY